MHEKKDCYLESSWQTHCSVDTSKFQASLCSLMTTSCAFYSLTLKGLKAETPWHSKFIHEVVHRKVQSHLRLSANTKSKFKTVCFPSFTKTETHYIISTCKGLSTINERLRTWHPKVDSPPISCCNSPRFSKVTFINLWVSEWGFGFRDEEDLQNASQSLSKFVKQFTTLMIVMTLQYLIHSQLCVSLPNIVGPTRALITFLLPINLSSKLHRPPL